MRATPRPHHRRDDFFTGGLTAAGCQTPAKTEWISVPLFVRQRKPLQAGLFVRERPFLDTPPAPPYFRRCSSKAFQQIKTGQTASVPSDGAASDKPTERGDGMNDQQINFTEGFAMPTYDAVGGRGGEGAEGRAVRQADAHEDATRASPLRPIYTRQDWPAAGDPSGFPGRCRSPAASALPATASTTGTCAQAYAHPDPGGLQRYHPAGARARRDVGRSRLRRAARAGLDGDAAGAAALAGVGRADALQRR